MPMWFPPTPPHDDPYVDECSTLLYVSNQPMTSESLSNVIIKKKPRQQATKTGTYEPRPKLPRYDVKVPKSLFSRQMGMKKKEKLKHKLQTTPKALPPSTVLSPVKIERVPPKSPPATSAPTPDWIINEDWELVQAVEQVLEMPLSLAALMPGHTPNWDLVADLVNTVSCVYRSAKECKQRFENVVSSFDEGKPSPRKKIKTALKFPVKTKLSKSQHMSLSHVSDNNTQFSTLYSDRFDACKVICGKRNPPKTSAGTGQFQRNPKHTNILHEKCGINYDKPLHPMQVAAARVKRLATQKKSSGSSDHVIGNVIPVAQQVNNLPQGGTIQHIGGAIITSGPSVVGKSPIQANATAIHHLAALPQSGVHSVMNSSLPRKVTPTALPGNVPKLQTVKSTGTSLALPGQEQQFTLQPSSQSVSLTFTAQSPVVTFTNIPACITSATVRPSIAYQARGPKLSTIQHIRQTKQQTSLTTPVKQQIKQENVPQPQQATLRQAVPSIVSGATDGKKVQAATLNHPQLVLQQHLLKHRQLTQQQQQPSRQVVGSKGLPQKTVYATVPSHQLVVSGVTTAVKMTPQIQAQMINQFVAQQQQQQRRVSGKTSGNQPPVTLTVTKLLQSPGTSSIRHSLLPQTSQISQQTSVPVASSNMSLSAVSTHPQPSTQQRQFQIPQVGQSAGSNQSHVTVTTAIVATTPIVMHRPPVVAIGNQLPQFRLRNPTPTSQINLPSSRSGVVINDPASTTVSVLMSHQSSAPQS